MAPRPKVRTRRSIAKEYFASLAESMAKFEDLARSSIDHKGEKGRTVESAVENALRTVLPDRYSLGTGFVINAVGERSPQLDLIIYDGLYNSPLMFGKGLGLFPVECVYGFIEVKSVLAKKDLDRIAEVVGEVRRIARDKTYVEYGSREKEPGKFEVVRSHIPQPLAPRSYTIAVRCTGFSNIDVLKSCLVERTQENDAHIHGLAVLQREWVLTQEAHTVPHGFQTTNGHALANLVMAILDGIQSIPMMPAALDRYLKE